MQPGEEPLVDDELIYRRIPTQPEFFNPAIDPDPTPRAFRPRKDDKTGISVYRAKYKSPEQVATNDRGKQFFVAVLNVGELRARGIEVAPDPNLPDDPGHAEITDLTYVNRKTPASKEIMVQLAHELTREVVGPLP